MDARKFLKWLVLIIVAINVAIISFMVLEPAPKPALLPVPNGYDDFARAAQLLSSNSPRYTNQTRDELEKIVSANSDALKLLHEGVTRESLVPDNYSATNTDAMMHQLASFKGLIFVLVVEGKFAEMDGRTNDAAKIYLDGVRFSEASSHGGVIISKLVGVACEAIALQPLQSLLPSLDAKQCAEVARALEEIDAKADSVETIMAHEKAYGRKVAGIQSQIVGLIMHKNTDLMRQKAVVKFQAAASNRRRAMISFAARAYELEKGKPTENPGDLIPAYLKAVPKDPVTGAPMTF